MTNAKVILCFVVLAILLALAANAVIYITSGPLFTFKADGTYCTYEGTPFEQCDCRPGWDCGTIDMQPDNAERRKDDGRPNA